MRTLFIFLLSIFLLANCQVNNAFQKEFSCEKTLPLEKLETNRDFKESFSVDIPKNWKTTLYYDESQSEIFCADTSKVFQETYLMEFAMKNGNISIDNSFKKQVNDITQKNQLTLVKENFIDFEDYRGFYHLGKGKKNETDIQVFQYYIKLSDDQYFLVSSEIYGTANVDERLCQVIKFINTLKFIPIK